MCLADGVTALRIGPVPSDWIMLATLGAFYVVQAMQHLRAPPTPAPAPAR